MQTRVSASQIKTYKLCPRKWAYEQLEGLRSPPTPATKLGTDVHAVLESLPDEGIVRSKGRKFRVAEPGLQYRLAGPREHKFEFVYGDILYNGIIDCHEVYPGPEPELLVQDWKTSSNPEATYNLTDETLADDEQFLMYGRAGLALHPHVRRVRGRWVYLATRGEPRARVAECRMHAQHVVSGFHDRVHKVGLQIHQARKLPTVEHEQHFDACGAFGGCPHVSRCHGSASVTDRLKSLMSQHLRGGHLPAALTRNPKEESVPSLLDLMEAEESGASPITPEEEPFVAAQPAANPTEVEGPEEAPSEAGQKAMEDAYSRAGEKLAPRKRGRPRGSKNKVKEPEAGPTPKVDLSGAADSFVLDLEPRRIFWYDVTQHMLNLMHKNESPEELEQLSRAYANVMSCSCRG